MSAKLSGFHDSSESPDTPRSETNVSNASSGTRQTTASSKPGSAGNVIQINLLHREETNPPVDYIKNYNHFAGARYIIECCMKLKASVLTTATAAVYYHKFFALSSLVDYDPYLIGCTCVYLASKVEDDDIKIRDIINVGISCIRRDEPPLSLDPYFTMRDSLVQAELLLMRVLGFKLKTDLPHKYIFHYVQALEDWVGVKVFQSAPVIKTAWTLIQDAHHSPIVIKYAPQLIALAALNLSLQIYGIIVPGCEELNDDAWYTFFYREANSKNISEVCCQILNVYEEEKDLMMFQKD